MSVLRSRVTSLALVFALQAGWWTSVVLAGSGHGLAAVVPQLALLAAFTAFASQRAARIALAVLGVVLAIAVDGTLRAAGLIGFPSDLDAAPAPPFMIALWATFAAALPVVAPGVVRLRGRAAALLPVAGAGAGALAYQGGASLGAIHLSVVDGAPRGLIAVALAWAAALPILVYGARTLTGSTANRRAKTIPGVVVAFLGAIVGAPLWFVAALVIDAARFLGTRRWSATTLRILAFGVVYLTAQVVGLAALLHASKERTYRIQAAWAGALFAAVRRIFRLTFVVDGLDEARAPGPVLVLVRHASIIDTLLPSVFLAPRTLGGVARRLRFVLKHELLADPCLDVAGTRLPNHFVTRRAKDTAADLVALTNLARQLDNDEGVVLFPEGTRATSAKRAHALAKLEAEDPARHARFAALHHVLPPKTKGIDALLQGATHADLLILAHTGLEGFATVADLWRGALVRRTVHLSLWRIPRANLPPAGPARTAFLDAQWARVDALAASRA